MFNYNHVYVESHLYTAQSQTCQAATLTHTHTHNLFIKSFVTALWRLKLRHLQAVRHPIPNALDGWINHAIVALSIYTHAHTHTRTARWTINNAQSPLNAQLLRMQNANCMRGKQANRAKSALLQDITHTPCQRLAAMSFSAQRKVSKFISNNYVAINKPMPAIKSRQGRVATRGG